MLLAIIQVESGGTLEDVMQSSESLGLPPNSLSTEESIKQGCKYFSELLAAAETKGCDLNSVIQSYNYGGGFLDYVAGHGKKYTFELAESFARDKSGGKKVTYTNPVAVEKNGGWRYSYGNMFYVLLVSQYLTVAQFDDETVQAIMEEALKYEGWTYVYGGDSPSTSFDCSGLVQWCYGKAGIALPRTAQEQYNVTQHIPLSEAKAGDLVFFHSTYNAGTYITVRKIHGNLTGGLEELNVIYEPDCTAEKLESTICANRERDMRMRLTSAGPHRDDLCVMANGIDIRKYGSQGQQRTAALSLKLSEIYIVKRKIKDTPVLLLDDVLSELDSSRQNYLLDSISDIQTLITCTGLDDFISHQFQINKVFQVVQGTVSQPV